MSTISIPLTSRLEDLLENMLRDGVAENKASLVRNAIEKYAEDKVVERILLSEQEIKEGKALRGDLDTLAKQFQ